MDRLPAASVRSRSVAVSGLTRELETELFRKSIHLLIALVPLLASIDTAATMALLGAGTIFYAYSEALRMRGIDVYVVSRVTRIASRNRELGRFVMGPITLGIGAMLALLLYPEPAATIAIFALAFGDGLSSFVGKLIGSARIPFTGGKTLAGSAACFVAVFLTSLHVSGSALRSLVIAAAATLLEALPSGDFDNILLPVGTGFVAARLLAVPL